MLSDVLFYLGAVVIFLWGSAHLAATPPIVKGFGEISLDNRRIITMEAAAEGLSLDFIGLLVITTTIMKNDAEHLANGIYLLSAAVLFVMAGLSWMTGAKTPILPMKICPIIKTCVASVWIIALII